MSAVRLLAVTIAFLGARGRTYACPAICAKCGAAESGSGSRANITVRVDRDEAGGA